MKKLAALVLSLMMACSAMAEDYTVLYVTASVLNGRVKPNRHSGIEARYERGDEVEALEYRNGWVKVLGGECGTVWCSSEYLSERVDIYRAVNTSGGRVRIHREPNAKSKSTGWVKTGKTVTVKQELFGWGRINGGWIDLSYFTEE